MKTGIIQVAALLALAILAASGPTRAMDTAPSTDLPDLSESRAALYAGDYERALALLEPLTATVRHADLYNLLGFANRNLKRYDAAARWYKEALFYDPVHRPAIEYQGELFIAIGDFKGAEKNLELLRLLCFPSGCEEHEKLRKALVAAGRNS
ncbi:tetratricopeptide repeat protein [Xanthobacter aminoxidans]|uniref:tetratricopeptide repeat protein n=1 Tax=Xanthobacter aminoxidans TaxID=186280 RepID=UPI002022F61D|nr:tetratricopeptide repeat protein [Xanthobacter aminoxidans]MCL8384835.1 tetratricopeptide repeat protein [Xanthobacter aminoxidans]